MGLIFTDIPELYDSKTEIVLSNLSELEKSFEVLIEKRLSHLSELAEAVISDGDDFDIIKSILLSMRSGGDSDNENIIEENQRDADFIYSKASLAERLILYKNVSCDYFLRHGESIINNGISEVQAPHKDATDKIAYLSNSFNDEAYIKLSTYLKHPRSVYFENTEDVCRAVFDGACEYCIFPTEASGVKLSLFYGLILKYGFWKCAEREIKTPDGYTRYALLRRGVQMPRSEKNAKHQATFLEFLIDPTEISLSDVLSACEFCNMKLRRIDTINGLVCIDVRCDKADIETFMTYILVECQGTIPLGIYKQI